MLFFISFGNVLGGGRVKHPTYVSETGQRVARISLKVEEHQNKKGEKYNLFTYRILGDTEDEVIEIIESLRKKLKVK